MSTIVLTGGGTAGHIMPHLALKPYLQQHFTNLVYIGSINGMEKNIISSDGGFKYYAVETAKLDRCHLLKNFKIPIKFLKGVKQAKQILKKVNPSIVFSKGGYVSLPVVFAAKSLNIPVVTHESDLTMGLANKLSKNKCSCICTTFKETADNVGKKGVFTGSPIRESSKSKTVISSNKPILLITGGSLGAKAVNTAVYESITELTKKFYVIHQVGKNNINNNIKAKDYKQIEFADNMQELIKLSDVIISRAGSNTIFELAYYNKPMLLIPLPKGASRGDQVDNAKYFERLGYAKVLLQENLNKDNLINAVNELFNNKNTYKTTLKNANLPNGTQKIVEILLTYKKDN